MASRPTSSSAAPASPSPSPSTPLLPRPRTRPRTPLPVLQLSLLCLVRLAEPVAASQILPYINDLCLHFGYARSDTAVGFVSGAIEALFALLQLLTVYHYGRLSDALGRKPVLLLGLLGVTLSTLLFGLSTHLPLTLLARGLAGALSGNSAVVQTMMSDLTDESNESQAFPLYSLTWTLGSVLGPALGGALSRPAERFPHSPTFARPFWRAYPYFLPCLASACVSGLSIFTSLFLRQTRPRSARAANPPPSYRTLSEAPGPDGAERATRPPPTTRQILTSPGLPTVLTTAFLMMLTTQAWDVLFPLFAYTSVPSGGLSLSDAQIGACLASAGLAGTAIHLLVFPPLERTCGTRIYPWLLACPMAMYAGAPLLNAFLKRAGGGEGDGDGDGWERGQVPGWTFAGAALLLAMGRVAAMVYPLNMILVKRAAPSKAAMGATYGLAQMVTASARVVGPWGVSALFALSAEKRLLGGHLIWAAMAGTSAIAVLQSLRVERALREAERGKLGTPGPREGPGAGPGAGEEEEERRQRREAGRAR
ncbi:MFS general substrate transporter [Calocera cornea HHB12733]|uniref:MFS general substrate transporter n=1 Tax=Calocera cornea HHB12733 TaxID=1353952 RepID=A0A165EBG8_9BASI|nr:MFS general substrate transporter [Calocera cornea HHB12733]